MFWTDWGAAPAIMRARMDGSFAAPIINSNLRWPNGVTIDHVTEQLYWVDAWHDRLEATDINGFVRTTLHVGDTHHPFGVTLGSDFVYWSDWFQHSVYRRCIGESCTTSDSPELLLLGSDPISRPFGLTVINTTSPRPGGRCLSICVCVSICLSV